MNLERLPSYRTAVQNNGQINSNENRYSTESDYEELNEETQEDIKHKKKLKYIFIKQV